MDVDWTRDYRICPSVEEYILLGECYDGSVGHNWHTWGNPAYRPEGESGDEEAAVPPYVKDGWDHSELGDVSRWMLSRFASDVAECEWSSSAISFRRGDDDSAVPVSDN